MRPRTGGKPTHLSLDGWPPATIHVPVEGGGYRIDPVLEGQWHRIRMEAMRKWKGFECWRCQLDITFVGRTREAHLLERTPSLIRALVAAGVLASETTFSGFTVRTRYGRDRRIEIEFEREDL